MFSSIKGVLADYYGLRVLPPDGEPDVTVTITEKNKETDLRLYAHDSSEIKISTFHLVERVVRQLFKLFVVFASIAIALVGFVGFLNGIAPTLALIGVISTIVSIALFFTSWYFDRRFKEELKEHHWLPLVKLDKTTYGKIIAGNPILTLKDSSHKFNNAFQKKVRNNQVYIPKAELELFLSKSASPTRLFTQALESLKSKATTIYGKFTHKSATQANPGAESLITA